ncbi:hypothetical protein [Novosphingobium nitrogenifigens]|uniref:hypothetical protein n=1 Tax=Novosphingobium nitrogenifigens TaxID=378548 RepID=UPI0002DEED4D|nr:hypothetical protein [Novosphingobium nitrogenifigens]
MTKLDYSKGYTFDPARTQRYGDVLAPDPVVMKVLPNKRKKKKHKAKPVQAQKVAPKRQAPVKQVIAKPKKVKPAKVAPVKPARTPEQAQAEAEAKATAKEAHRHRCLAKARRREAEIAAKKKSHLRAWADSQTELNSDREELRRRWRAALLSTPPSL